VNSVVVWASHGRQSVGERRAFERTILIRGDGLHRKTHRKGGELTGSAPDPGRTQLDKVKR